NSRTTSATWRAATASPRSEGRPNRVTKCSKCHQTGHNARTYLQTLGVQAIVIQKQVGEYESKKSRLLWKGKE
ncbi:hypothetical protein LINPERPRIM_LOCUS38381, partial [Linum perenne]